MQPTYFINHGGGPCFFLEPGLMRDSWSELERYLAGFAATLDQAPRALLVISGHWEEACPTVNVAPSPPLLFDYQGFPAHTYRLTWPAPGAPDVAARVSELLSLSAIENGAEASRGWDHGVFVPLKVMFPTADVPTVQLSLQRGLDPARHLAIGRALKPLRNEGVLIIGSGQSYHNMRGLFGSTAVDTKAEAFDDWLCQAMTDPTRRDGALIDWASAPGARSAQPHEDHLLPLMVAAGAATNERGQVDFHGQALGKPISGFRFG
jgi:aromatic ring-opening dioxygenase catalytic subunit (LigB family)